MCDWGTEKEVRLNRARGISGRTTVMVDACIADKVQALNDAGVHTLGSCCGHGKTQGSIIIEENGQRKELKV